MAKSVYDKTVWTAEDIVELRKLISMLDVRSLDKPLGVKTDGEEMASLGELTVDPRPSPEEIVEENETRRILLQFIEKLPPRELVVIKMRFGFDDGRPKTLEEIGKYFSVTRERVRQIEAKALRKLKWNITVKGKYRSIDDF